MLRCTIINLLLTAALFGCSGDQEKRQQLVRDVERLVLEHERFVLSLARYDQERERFQERTAAMLMSALLPNGAAGLAGQAAILSDDAQQFEPEAQRLYKEGERLAWELWRTYEQRDSLADEGQQLTIEREKLAKELERMSLEVDLIKEEGLRVDQEHVRQLEQAAPVLAEVKQAYSKALEAENKQRLIHLQMIENLKEASESVTRWLELGKLTNEKKLWAIISQAKKLRDQNVILVKITKKEHDKVKQKTSRAEAEYNRVEQEIEQIEQAYKQRIKRLSEDLESAHLNWSWLEPYLNRLVRDVGLRVRID